MQVKKFEAPTIQEALETIKREVGPEAVILQTKKNKKGFGLMSKTSVEITVAVSERSLHKKKFVESRLPDADKEAIKKMPADRQAQVYDEYLDRHLERAVRGTQDKVSLGSLAGARASVPGGTKRYIDIQDDDGPELNLQKEARSKKPAPQPRAQAPVQAQVQPRAAAPIDTAQTRHMEAELKYLKRMVEELRTAQDERSNTQNLFPNQALQDAFEQIVISGVDKRYALNLIKQASFELGEEESKNAEKVLDQLAIEIMGSTEILSALSGVTPNEGKGPTVIALVGPTGVGKTTTVAKMAGEASVRRNLKVGLINVDNHKMNAFDQLGTYAKILNVPFRSAGTIEDLKAAIEDFKNLDLVLVDTTGRSQRDPLSLKDMQVILQAVPQMRTQLVLSATTRDAEMYDMATRFSIFRPQGLIFSKLDEATTYGCIYNVSQRVKLPLLYFTTGQKVPEDLEEATKERVVALVMDL